MLYAIVGAALTVLATLEAASLSDTARTVARALVVVAAFAAMTVWIHRQRAVLDLQDWCECAGPKVRVRVIPSSSVMVSTPDLEPVHEVDELAFIRS